MIRRTVGIIGGGPGGITAAIQLQRYGISTIMVERQRLGGLLRNANRVENYPGFPGGIRGDALADLMISQMDQLGVEVLMDTVQSCHWNGSEFILQTIANQITCEFLILASGTKPVSLPQNVVDPSARAAVYYEVTDLPPCQQAEIVIIGGGDAAFDYALHLCSHQRVAIYYRGEKPRCLLLLWQRASLSSTIQINPLTQVVSVCCDGNGKPVLTLYRQGDYLVKRADFVLVAIGRQPALDFLSSDLLQQMDTLEREKRCFRVGDVRNGLFRQTAIAVGDGMRAAMQIAQSLQEVTL